MNGADTIQFYDLARQQQRRNALAARQYGQRHPEPRRPGPVRLPALPWHLEWPRRSRTGVTAH